MCMCVTYIVYTHKYSNVLADNNKIFSQSKYVFINTKIYYVF